MTNLLCYFVYRGFYPPYKVMCGNITELRCDFSSVLQPFGVYSFRVRAELQGEGSPWVEISNFVMDEHSKNTHTHTHTNTFTVQVGKNIHKSMQGHNYNSFFGVPHFSNQTSGGSGHVNEGTRPCCGYATESRVTNMLERTWM